MVAEGQFREDLFYRLNVIDIRMPALRDHRDDIALLVSRFLKELSAANSCNVTGIEPAALKALEDYDWPGNVRQLRNVIEKMVVLATGPKLTYEDLPVEVTTNEAIAPTIGEALPASSPLQKETNLSTVHLHLSPSSRSLASNEKDLILSVLAKCGGNKSKAADELGISRRTIHRKLKEWGL